MLFRKSPTLEDTLSVLRVKAYQATIIILYILPLIPIWYFDYLPIQDYPRHLAGIKVLREYFNNSFLQEHFSVDFFRWFSPIPNVAFELFATKVCFFLDINITGKLFISIYVMLFVLSLYLLSRELKMNYADVLLMSLPLVYSTYLYIGFLNFIFGIPLFLTAIWCYLCAKRDERYFVLLVILSMILYLSHLFVFASFLLFLFIDLVLSDQRSGKRFIILTTASALIPLSFSVHFILSNTGHPAYYHPDGIPYKIVMLISPFLYFSFGVGIVIFFFYIYALLFIFYGSSVFNRVFLAASASFLFLYFILPFGTTEGTFVDIRAIAFSMVMLPLSVRLEESRYKWGVFILIVLLMLINTTVAWSSFSKFNREMSAGQSCLKKVEEKSRLLPVSAGEAYGPFGSYFFGELYAHLWGYAFLDKDFITPDFSSKVHHVLRYKKEPYTPPSEWYSMEDVRWSSQVVEVKRNYDYMAIFGRDSAIKNSISRIGTKVCEGGIITLYRVNQ